MAKRIAALALAALLPVAASATDLDYSYVELAHSNPHSDIFFGGYGSTKGYRLDGSFGLTDHWFLEAAHQRDVFNYAGPAEPSGTGVTTQKTLLGGGFHTPLADGLDLVIHAAYGQATTTTSFYYSGGSSFDDHGQLFGLGLRFRPIGGLELDAGVDHDDLGFGEAQGRLGNPYYFVAAQGGTENIYSAAVRYRFGLLGVGVEYRYGSFQGWRDWLFSLRANF